MIRDGSLRGQASVVPLEPPRFPRELSLLQEAVWLLSPPAVSGFALRWRSMLDLGMGVCMRRMGKA